VLAQLGDLIASLVNTIRLGAPVGDLLFMHAANMALIPLFLALYYALIRRHGGAAD
jgi:hypothetical protein